ncbi:hypothetical protein GTO27_12875 [Candidatus Bathyarchaeota archaeon]|nr:hypothetical protein [Candidatus Bathyarchaeota archaeon]
MRKSAVNIALIQELMRVLVLGAIRSGTLALLSLGFTLIYGISGVVNLSYGSFFMIGAYAFYAIGVTLAFLLGSTTTLAVVLAVVGAILIVAIIGGSTYRTTIHPILGDEIGVMVVTVGLAMIFQEIIMIIFGFPLKSVRWPEDSFLRGLIDVLGVAVSYEKILAALASLALFAALVLFIRRTKTGKAMTAVSQDREVAMLMGVNTNRLYILTMTVSAMLASVAGILITTSTTLNAFPFMWMQPLFLAFSIVILGGLGSIKGSLVGSFIVGYAEVAVTLLIDSSIAGVAPLSVMVIVLLLKPKGLFGKRIELEE